MKAFELAINLDSGSSLPASEKPLRYGKLPEIHHIFKSDPKSPPKIITLVFSAAVIAALPILLGTVSSLIALGLLSILISRHTVDLTWRKSEPFL